MMGDTYTIADIAIFPMVNNLIGYYNARELTRYDEFGHVDRVLQTFLARPAVQVGLRTPDPKG